MTWIRYWIIHAGLESRPTKDPLLICTSIWKFPVLKIKFNELDFYCLCRPHKSSSSNLIFQTRNFKIQVQINRGRKFHSLLASCFQVSKPCFIHFAYRKLFQFWWKRQIKEIPKSYLLKKYMVFVAQWFFYVAAAVVVTRGCKCHLW